MITSISQSEIIPLLCHQLGGFFPLDKTEKGYIKRSGEGKISY